MQKWEYCCVGPIKADVGSWKGHYPYLRFFEPDGLHDKRIKGERGLTEEAVLAATVAHLGEEGWEMVGCGIVGDLSAGSGDLKHLLYFKRPKQ
jgi:hypothetical protein